MPPRLAPTARSSSRSSKRGEPPAPAGSLAPDAVVAVGQIVGAHALRGLVRVRADPGPSLVPGRRVLLEVRGARREATVVTAAPHGRGLVLVALEGVGDRTAAEALRGARVLVPTTDLPSPAADEFYYHEMVGVRVETTDGRALGVIVETFSTGTNNVWVVRDGTREHLIPVIADVVRAIDRAAHRVVIHPLPGLLD